jgi:hypothetical protein
MLLPPAYASPCLKCNKTDAAHAALLGAARAHDISPVRISG